MPIFLGSVHDATDVIPPIVYSSKANANSTRFGGVANIGGRGTNVPSLSGRHGMPTRTTRR